ncbi:MAG: TIR domain-containing protein [Xanthobacteraceae bacterium]
MSKIAVSYRREDSGPVTGRIFDRLVARYGKQSVFRDIENIPAGADFRHHIDDVLRNTNTLIVVLGRKWVGPVTAGRSRIHDEDDPVRIELETALQRGVSIIPVLIGDAKMPKASQLPESLKDFTFLNAVRVDPGQDFDHHTDRLIRSIERTLQPQSDSAGLAVAGIDAGSPFLSPPVKPPQADEARAHEDDNTAGNAARVKRVGYTPKYWWTAAAAFTSVLAAIVVVLINKGPSGTASPVRDAYFIGSITRIENQYQQFNNQPLTDKVKKDIQEAIELAAKREFQAAIERYKRLPDDAQVPFVLNDLGVAYEGLQDWPSAQATYAQAIEKNPDFTEATKNYERVKEKKDLARNNELVSTPAPVPSPPSPPITRPTPGVYFFDDFATKELGRDWKMMNADPNKWTLQPAQKSLLIVTQTGSLADPKNLKNWLILDKDLPTTDFEVIVEASIQIQGRGNNVSAALFQDEQNYIWIGLSGDKASYLSRAPRFLQRSQGKVTSDLFGENSNGAAQAPERLVFKINRTANQYSGFYAYGDQSANTDQIAWKNLGTVAWINFKGKVVLSAANSQDGYPEVPAEFHSVRIRTK